MHDDTPKDEDYVRGFKEGVKSRMKIMDEVKTDGIKVMSNGDCSKPSKFLERQDKVIVIRNEKWTYGEVVYAAAKPNEECRFGIIRKNDCPWDANRNNKAVKESYSIYWQDKTEFEKIYVFDLPIDSDDIKNLDAILNKVTTGQTDKAGDQK